MFDVEDMAGKDTTSKAMMAGKDMSDDTAGKDIVLRRKKMAGKGQKATERHSDITPDNIGV